MKLKDGSIALVEPEIDGVYPPRDYEKRKKEIKETIKNYEEQQKAEIVKE